MYLPMQTLRRKDITLHQCLYSSDLPVYYVRSIHYLIKTKTYPPRTSCVDRNKWLVLFPADIPQDILKCSSWPFQVPIWRTVDLYALHTRLFLQRRCHRSLTGWRLWHLWYTSPNAVHGRFAASHTSQCRCS